MHLCSYQDYVHIQLGVHSIHDPSSLALIVAPCSLPPLWFPTTPSFSVSLSFGLPLQFIARGSQTAEKPPCMERSVISTLSAKHTAFHIVLQGLGQIAIFMGHDKGNATLCSHFLPPDVRTCHDSPYWKLVCVVCVCLCVFCREKMNMNIVVALLSRRQ